MAEADYRHGGAVITLDRGLAEHRWQECELGMERLELVGGMCWRREKTS